MREPPEIMDLPRTERTCCDARVSHTVSGMLVLALLDGAERAGMDAEAICRDADIDRDHVDPDGAVDEDREEALWKALARVGGRSAGVDVALARPVGAFRAIEYAMIASASLGDALECLVRYHRLVHDDDILFLESGDQRTRVIYRFPHSPDASFRRIATEFVLATIARLARECSGAAIVPSEVWTCFPRDSLDLAARLSVPVTYDADVDAVWFELAELEQPLPQADPTLVDILERQMEEELPGHVGEVSRQVRRAMVERLRHGEPSLESVARTLALGGRTLQQHLHGEGTSFQKELDSVREALAREYLAHRELSVPEVALLVGYGESSAFHRAFKRWTQTTPHRYRQSLRES